VKVRKTDAVPGVYLYAARMEVMGGILLALFAGYALAMFRRTTADHKRARSGEREMRSKQWNHGATAVLAIGLLVFFLYVLVRQ
jgi:hypothetical protein